MSDALKPAEECFDYSIPDTALSWDSLTINALFFRNEVLMPVSPEILSLHGLAEFSKGRPADLPTESLALPSYHGAGRSALSFSRRKAYAVIRTWLLGSSSTFDPTHETTVRGRNGSAPSGGGEDGLAGSCSSTRTGREGVLSGTVVVLKACMLFRIALSMVSSEQRSETNVSISAGTLLYVIKNSLYW